MGALPLGNGNDIFHLTIQLENVHHLDRLLSSSRGEQEHEQERDPSDASSSSVRGTESVVGEVPEDCWLSYSCFGVVIQTPKFRPTRGSGSRSHRGSGSSSSSTHPRRDGVGSGGDCGSDCGRSGTPFTLVADTFRLKSSPHELEQHFRCYLRPIKLYLCSDGVILGSAEWNLYDCLFAPDPYGHAPGGNDRPTTTTTTTKPKVYPKSVQKNERSQKFRGTCVVDPHPSSSGKTDDQHPPPRPTSTSTSTSTPTIDFCVMLKRMSGETKSSSSAMTTTTTTTESTSVTCGFSHTNSSAGNATNRDRERHGDEHEHEHEHSTIQSVTLLDNQSMVSAMVSVSKDVHVHDQPKTVSQPRSRSQPQPQPLPQSPQPSSSRPRKRNCKQPTAAASSSSSTNTHAPNQGNHASHPKHNQNTNGNGHGNGSHDHHHPNNTNNNHHIPSARTRDIVQSSVTSSMMADIAMERSKREWEEWRHREELQWHESLRQKEQAAMKVLEEQAQARERSRLAEIEASRLQYVKLEAKLKKTYAEVEAKAKELRTEAQAQQALSERRKADLDAKAKLMRDETKHWMEIEKAKAKAALERAAESEKALRTAQKRFTDLEEEFQTYKVKQRKTPESALLTEVATLKGTLADVESRLQNERTERNRTRFENEQLRDTVDRLARALQREKEKYVAKMRKDAEELRLAYIVSKNKQHRRQPPPPPPPPQGDRDDDQVHVLDSERSELRRIQQELVMLNQHPQQTHQPQENSHHFSNYSAMNNHDHDHDQHHTSMTYHTPPRASFQEQYDSVSMQQPQPHHQPPQPRPQGSCASVPEKRSVDPHFQRGVPNGSFLMPTPIQQQPQPQQPQPQQQQHVRDATITPTTTVTSEG